MKSRLEFSIKNSDDDAGAIDPALERLIERVAAKLQAGEPMQIDEVVAAHPEFAHELAKLLPAIEMLVHVGNSPPESPRGKLPFRELGDFRILREIGRGGMGTVFEAQ